VTVDKARSRDTASARDIALALKGKRASDGNWLCHCPGPNHKHGDRNPSLSVKDGRNGRPVIYCFALCEYDDVVDALEGRGLKLRVRP
jgi:hypothetical protein